MAVGVVGQTLPTTVAHGQILTEQNFADDGATLAYLYAKHLSPASWVQPFQYSVAQANGLTYAWIDDVNGFRLYVSAGGPGAHTSEIYLPIRATVGQVITAVDFRLFEGAADVITCRVYKYTSLSSAVGYPSTTQLGTATSPGTGGHKLLTVTLGTPFTVDTTTALRVMWRPNVGGDEILGYRVY